MGLTGVILDATVRLLRIETSRCSVDTTRTPDLDTLLTLMDEGDRYYRYSVAWIDLMAKGSRLGRSILTRGDHATTDQLAPRDAVDPLAYDPHQLVAVPPLVPPAGLLNHATVAAFNELWYRKAPRRRIGQIVSISSYFHILDAIGSWNRLYGRPGFLQYQFVVPFGQEAALRTVVERLAGSGTASFLAVLKRFGAANPGPLSFPIPGWTLALDLPGGQPRAGRAAPRPRRGGARRRWPPLPGQGLAHDPRPPSAGAIPAWPSGRRCGPRSTRPASGRATRAGGYDSSTTEPEDPWRTPSANRRPSCCWAAAATSAAPSCRSC